MTNETVEMVLAPASSAANHIRVDIFKNGRFEDTAAWWRYLYEKVMSGSSGISVSSEALENLSVCFTDFNERRWRRREDGKVERLGKG
jgi:hypothetical protein